MCVTELETRDDGVWSDECSGGADTRVTTHERRDSELSAAEGRRGDFDVTHERRVTRMVTIRHMMPLPNAGRGTTPLRWQSHHNK